MARKPKVEAEMVLPTMTKNELVEYIKENHRLFTMAEMAEFTGFSYSQVKAACDYNGYIAISLGERVKEYIECNMHLTLLEQARKLEMGIENLKVYYKKFGYDHKEAGKGQRIRPTNLREQAGKIIRELGSLPLHMIMGPIARSYNIEENPLDTINKARVILLG